MRARLLLPPLLLAGCPRETLPTFEVTANQEPVARMTVPEETPAHVDISVDGAASLDVDGTITEYAWTFDTGMAPVTGPTATHRYQQPGLYTVELRVTDDRGKRGRARQRIRVVVPPDVEAPRVESVTLRADGTPVAQGARVAGGTALQLEAHVADTAGNLASVTTSATGPLGELALAPAGTQAVTGATATVLFAATAPDAAGTVAFSVLVEDAFHNAAAPWTSSLVVVPAGADTDGDGLPDAADPDPAAFNGMRARAYVLDSVPRDLLQRQRAEAVFDAVASASPAFTARVGEGFLHMATSVAPASALPGLVGAPATASLFAVRYTGTLVPPAGADSVQVSVGGDDLAVVFLGGDAVASADQEYARDFFRVDRVAADSGPITVAGAVAVEILVANEEGPYAWEVRFTFNQGDTVVLAPEQVGRAQFLADGPG